MDVWFICEKSKLITLIISMKNKYLFRLLLLFMISFACDNSSRKDCQEIVTGDVSFLDDVSSSYSLAYEWFRHSLRDKGIFRYNFQPGQKNVYSNKNNAIRQLMASRLMAEISNEDSSFLEPHQRNLNFLMKYWYKETPNQALALAVVNNKNNESVENKKIKKLSSHANTNQFKSKKQAFIYYNKKSKLGANAMMLRTLVASPFFENYTKQAEKLYQGINATIAEDGSMKAFYLEPNYNYDNDYLLTFYSGEAIIALVEYALKIGSKEVMDMAKRCQHFYIEKYGQVYPQG